MKNFTSLKLVAAMVPIFALGLGSAMAAEQQRDGTERNAMEEQRGAGDRDAMREQHRDAMGEQRGADDRNDAPHLDRMPAQGLHASDLMDKKIHSRESDEEIGEVNDLVIDQDGRVLAVVIGTGGVLGMGEKDVAIAWDRIDHTTEDDEIKLYVDLDEDTLKDTPEYERD